ncbi:MAG: TonB-dependent receptor, partial [Gammaproteobacteria bacterium]
DFSDGFNDGNWTATANVQYAFTDDVLGYVGYSRGQKSGGWNVDFVASLDDLPFDEETVDSFEAGIKSDLLNGRLRLNGSVYHAKYHDFQVFQFQFTGTTTNLIVSNAAEATTKGVEIEGTAFLTDNFEVEFGVGLADAEFDDFPGGAIDDEGNPINVAGNALVRAPKWTSSVTARYHFMIGQFDGTASVNHTYRDKVYFNPDNRDQSRQSGYSLWNASLDVALSERWSLGVWGHNLGDKEYRTMRGVSFLGVPFSLFARGISYGAEVRVRL